MLGWMREEAGREQRAVQCHSIKMHEVKTKTVVDWNALSVRLQQQQQGRGSDDQLTQGECCEIVVDSCQTVG